MEFLTH
ncbi:unnamed protein product [Ophioblennius macclurei]